MNEANAILILGAIYLHLAFGLDIVITAFICFWGFFLWAYHGYTQERKEIFEAQAEYYKAKAEYYRRKGRFLKDE